MAILKQSILKLVEPWLKSQVVGIDISDLSIKYLKFSSRGKLDFDFFGRVDVPEGIIAGGEIKREDDLAKIIKELGQEGKKNFRSSFAIASLPEEKSFVRLVQVPKVKRDEVGNVVRWEIENHIPVPVEELIFDYEIVNSSAGELDHLDVVLTAFPKVLVESYVRVLQKAGFNIMALELESQAIVRSLVKDPSERMARIAVDMGRTRTSLILVNGGAITFTTTMEFSGRAIEDQIAKELSADKNKAADLKKRFGLGKIGEGAKISQALLPLLTALSGELKRVVEYNSNHPEHTHGGDPKVGEILLVGGEANLRGLDTFLASATKIPVRLGDPLTKVRDNLGSKIISLPKQDALSFTTALGLAMRYE